MLHARRDRLAIVFALMMPLMQMVILGTAIDTNVRQVPTVVFDASGANQRDGTALLGTQASRAFIDRLRNTDTYRVYRYVDSDDALNQEMVAGRARVAIKIPLTFARDLLAGRQAQVLVMVDGSDSAVAGQALNVATQVGLDESLKRMLPEGVKPVIDVRQSLW